MQSVRVLTLLALAALALSGCSDNGSSTTTLSAPTANGPDESKLEPSADGRFEQAEGVTYPDDDPIEFAERPRSESCGREGVVPTAEFAETRPEPKARRCLLDAWASAAEAKMTTAFPTDEGPALVILRVLAGGTVERYELDHFGGGAIMQVCRALKADGELIGPGDSAPAKAPRMLAAVQCDPRQILD